MITLPAATLIVTMLAASAGVTMRPAAVAILRCKFEVSAKSSMVPLAVKVSTTVTAEGGGDGVNGGGAGGRSRLTLTLIFCPNMQWSHVASPPRWHEKYSIPGCKTTAW
jgi:hypothetical protein